MTTAEAGLLVISHRIAVLGHRLPEFVIPRPFHSFIHPTIGKTRGIFPLILDPVPDAWMRRVGLRRREGREGNATEGTRIGEDFTTTRRQRMALF